MSEHTASHKIRSASELEQLVQQYGFLPFFANSIKSFSVEEHTPPELWFSDTDDGPWEWKGPVARMKTCVYGKFFQKKAGFISLEWLADFANYRRDGYDFDARCDDGLVFYKDKYLYETIAGSESILTPELKAKCNYVKGGNKGFETVITRLQMQTYITVADFDYMRDKNGKQYGWGVARYSTPETILGYDAVTSAYHRSPAESRKRIIAHLLRLFPSAAREDIQKLIK